MIHYSKNLLINVLRLLYTYRPYRTGRRHHCFATDISSLQDVPGRYCFVVIHSLSHSCRTLVPLFCYPDTVLTILVTIIVLLSDIYLIGCACVQLCCYYSFFRPMWTVYW